MDSFQLLGIEFESKKNSFISIVINLHYKMPYPFVVLLLPKKKEIINNDRNRKNVDRGVSTIMSTNLI